MRSLWLPVLAALAVTACNKKEAQAPAAATPGKQAGVKAGAAKPAASVEGKILESLEAGPYSYLRLAADGGELWAAVPRTDKPVGTTVEVLDPMRMDGFESKTLGRKFDKIVFGRLADSAAAKMPAGHPQMGSAMPAGHPPIGNAMPAGHPPTGNAVPAGHPPTGNAMPPGHPPIGNGMPAGHPPVDAAAK